MYVMLDVVLADTGKSRMMSNASQKTIWKTLLADEKVFLSEADKL